MTNHQILLIRCPRKFTINPRAQTIATDFQDLLLCYLSLFSENGSHCQVHFLLVTNLMNNGFMYVCKKCGSLCYLRGDVWQDPELSAESIEAPDKKEKTFSLEQNDMTSASNFIGFINSAKCLFPLCPVCCQIVIKLMKGRINFYQNAAAFYSRLDIPCKSVFGEMLTEEVESMKLKIDELKNISTDFSDSKIEFTLNAPTKATEPSADNEASQKSTVIGRGGKKRQNSTRAVRSPRNLIPFASLSVCGVFRIINNKHFPTINNSRLGRLILKQVSPDEFERAFICLTQLIIYFAQLASIELPELMITCTVCVRSGEKIINMAQMDLSKRKEISQFNEAFGIYVEAIQKVFQSFKQYENLSVPYTINLQNHTIGVERKSFCYIYQQKSPQIWTNAMRLIFHDFKCLQRYSLRKSIRNLSIPSKGKSI